MRFEKTSEEKNSQRVGGKRVLIFDTTLRDGEQTPGVCLTAVQKIFLGQKIDELGVDVIEAGFPAASLGERKVMRELSSIGLNAKVCGLARVEKSDIDAVIDSGGKYVHTFIATSDLHMKSKLHLSREQVLEKIFDSVQYAKSRGVECEFTCEDATRSDPVFLLQAYKTALEAGADMLNVADTVGLSTPKVFGELVGKVVAQSDKIISVHCHNDFGLATANSLAGVEAGARQVQCTINGLGERSGNAALEEVVMALDFMYSIKTNVKKRKLFETSQVVSTVAKVFPQPNKAIVGENAFSHEAGIHVHGMLANALCYEPFLPSVVGRESRIVFGKLTGRHAVEAVAKKLGFDLTNEQVSLLTARIKALGDEGSKVDQIVFQRLIAEIAENRLA